MIKYLLLLLSLGFLMNCQTENLEPSSNAFFKIYGGQYQEEGIDLLETDDGGFIIVGYTTSLSKGEYKDIFVVKTNEFGLAEWTKILLSNNGLNDEAVSIKRTFESGENYVVVGTSGINKTDSIQSDIFACKISVDGNVFWENTYDTFIRNESDTIKNRADFGIDVQLRLDGEMVIVGNSLLNDGYEIIAFKVNANGDRIDDMFTFGLESELGGVVNDISNRVINNENPLISASGLILGSTNASLSGNDEGDNVYMLYYSDNLTNINEFTFGGPGNQRADDVAWSLDGGYMVLTTNDYNESGFGNINLIKVNDNLETQSTLINGNDLNFGVNEEVTRGRSIIRSNSRYILAAEYKERPNADSDILLMETDQAGQVKWFQFYGGDNSDKINSVILTQNGSIAFTGMLSFVDSDQVTKMILVKTDPNGKIIP